ncbi:MAG: hypothetical protein JWR37_1400 [Mycobacterium sp.]|jgi:uncharacterized surface protein with fasciclin (FAS1) repeats|nr:hypothetical protein [Mycobacterium sp.]
MKIFQNTAVAAASLAALAASGNDLKVNNASVWLRFTPANATVYLIDTVMMPPM